MSLRKVTLLGSNLASVTDLKGIQTRCDFWGDKTLNLYNSLIRLQSSGFEPLSVIWQTLRLFQKVIEGLEGEINCQTLGVALLQSPVLLRLALVRLASTNTGCFQVSCSCCWSRQASLRKTCNHSWDTESVKYDIGTKPHVPNQILYKAGLNWRPSLPVQGKGVCSWIEQHCAFRWHCTIAWKRCQAWFWIDSNQRLQTNWLQMKCKVWKPCSDQCSQNKL